MRVPVVSADAIHQAVLATKASAPREICGYFSQDPSTHWHFTQCRNLSADPDNAFEVSHHHLSQIRQKTHPILVHSHPKGPGYPSYQDMQMLASLGLPGAVIVPSSPSPDGYVCLFYGGVQPLDITRRGFCHGVTDCFALVRDYYAAHFNIVLPDYPREWAWWHHGHNYYRDHYARYDFVSLRPEEPLQKGDICLMKMRSDVDNHSGIYVGEGCIIHHLAGRDPVDKSRLVRRDSVMRLLPFITLWLRHRSQISDEKKEELCDA